MPHCPDSPIEQNAMSWRGSVESKLRSHPVFKRGKQDKLPSLNPVETGRSTEMCLYNSRLSCTLRPTDPRFKRVLPLSYCFFFWKCSTWKFKLRQVARFISLPMFNTAQSPLPWVLVGLTDSQIICLSIMKWLLEKYLNSNSWNSADEILGKIKRKSRRFSGEAEAVTETETETGVTKQPTVKRRL